RGRVEGREDRAAADVEAEGRQPVVRRPEVRRHAPLPLDTSLERQAQQLALQIVGPLVIGARERRRMPRVLEAELRAPMRAAVEEAADRAVLAPDDQDRLLTDRAALVVAALRDLALERDVA